MSLLCQADNYKQEKEAEELVEAHLGKNSKQQTHRLKFREEEGSESRGSA